MTRVRGVIVGAPRCGTTTLWRQLVQHPSITASRVKELNFDAEQEAGADYDRHFRAGGTVTLEASPMLFREYRTLAPRLAQRLPDARLLFILREPAARLLAGFRSARDWDRTVDPAIGFDQFATILASDADPAPLRPNAPEKAAYAAGAWAVGRYADTLCGWLDWFDAEQMRVLFLENLASSPDEVLHRACRHLGVDSLPDLSRMVPRENAGVEIRNRRLHAVARAANRRLEPVLNRAPVLRSAARALHHGLNARPADRDSTEVVRGLDIARAGYAEDNARLAELMRTVFPDDPLPDWVRA